MWSCGSLRRMRIRVRLDLRPGPDRDRRRTSSSPRPDRRTAPICIPRRDARAFWSPLEYGCHVRDVLMVQRERILPRGAWIDRRSIRWVATNVSSTTATPNKTPSTLPARSPTPGTSLPTTSRVSGPPDWERTVMYNYPATLERSLRWVAVHTVHEVHHHLLDVRRQLAK